MRSWQPPSTWGSRAARDVASTPASFALDRACRRAGRLVGPCAGGWGDARPDPLAPRQQCLHGAAHTGHHRGTGTVALAVVPGRDWHHAASLAWARAGWRWAVVCAASLGVIALSSRDPWLRYRPRDIRLSSGMGIGLV